MSSEGTSKDPRSTENPRADRLPDMDGANSQLFKEMPIRIFAFGIVSDPVMPAY